MRPDTETDAKPNPAAAASRTGNLLWNKASMSAKPSIMFSSSFSTLRDRIVDAEIPKNKLTTVKKLGEGAFAVVDKAIYRTDDGFERQVAVKRLKPDVSPSPNPSP